MSQHDRDSRELRELCAARDAARAETNRIVALLDAANEERKALRAEVERLRPNALRYEFLKGRMCGADFDWNENGIYGLVFELPKNTAVSASCDDTIDRAIEAAKEAK